MICEDDKGRFRGGTMSFSNQKSAEIYTHAPIVIREPPPRIVDLELPADLHIAPAGSKTPPAAARFLGAWIGFSADALPHVLVVERMDKDGTADVLYAARGPGSINVS